MKSDYLIIWQKWFDPFGSDEDNPESLFTKNSDDIDNDGDYEENSENTIRPSQPLKAIATPFGLIPYTENTASSKIFNFWVGHCNFNLSKPVVDILETCEGVETLDVFTRYRFRIAIGKVFDDAEVMKNINDQIYTYLDKNGNTK